MPETPAEMKKLATIATDMDLSAEMREKALETIGRIGTHEALLVLLEIAANEGLIRHERELALKFASQIVKSSH